MAKSNARPLAAWRVYQNEAASFFTSLGFDAATDVQVSGARGRNNVDVIVRGSSAGIPFLWIVECKHWRSNVPKEKVQAFLTVVQNVGADRGYLLSEKGFQSGAVDVARHTNVHLGSVAALKADTAEWARGDLVRRWRERKNDLVRILMRMHREIGNPYSSKFSEAAGPIFWLDTAIDEGLRDEFPVPLLGDEPAADWKRLAFIIEARLANAAKVAGLGDKSLLTDPLSSLRKPNA